MYIICWLSTFMYNNVTVTTIQVLNLTISSWHCCSAAQLCPILCDPAACSIPGSPVLHHLWEFSSILSSIEAKEDSPALWVSCSLPISESATKVSYFFLLVYYSLCLNQNYILKNYHLPSHEDMGSLSDQRKYLHKIHCKILLCSKFLKVSGASLRAHLVKNPPVQFLGQKDPLEKEKGTHSKILAWRIPWTV